jgi:hypothetical protein
MQPQSTQITEVHVVSIQDILDEMAGVPSPVDNPPFSQTEPVEPRTDPTPAPDAAPPKPKKRNSGRTGPTSAAGRATSAQNARKHGACATTLILPSDSQKGWLILLSRWHDTYKPREESLEADFVLRTAQAEWFRIRTQHGYDDFLKTTSGLPLHMWTPEQIKMHELMLRYKTAAERSFHREYRALEAHYKSHKLAKHDLPFSAPVPPPVFVRVSSEHIRKKIMAGRGSTPLSPLYPSPPPG